MKIVIAGGTGQVGTILARAFHQSGHEIVVLSRKPKSAPWRIIRWDGETLGTWAAELEGAEAVINLAGRSVNCRYTPENRRIIKESRVNSTRIVGEAIARTGHPPRVWLQASTATIYAHRYDAPNDEASDIVGGIEPNTPDTWRFSTDVALFWERAVDQAMTPKTRQVKLRTGIVMSPNSGGAFDVLLGLVRHGLGGQAGNGQKYVSWIHDTDFVRAIAWLIEHEEIAGPANLVAPYPVPNAAFMRSLREAWGISFGLAEPEWLLEVGAFFLRTETELILKSRRVIPSRLLEAGFTFDFPCWSEASRDLCTRWRKTKRGNSDIAR